MGIFCRLPAVLVAFWAIAAQAQVGPGGSFPTGPAGGGLAGTYPDPTVSAVPASAMPALTGNCTTSAGAVATTCTAQSEVVNSTYNLTTASGTQIVTGFGFTPSSCDGFGTVDGSATTAYTTIASHSDSALNQGATYFGTSAVNMSTTAFFVAVDTTGANFQTGTITSYGAGSVTITWVKTLSPTGTFSFSMRCFQ